MALDFSQSPYFDDYDENKDYYRLLFRPEYAVQSRELTQIQTGLQRQLERFGKHIFKEGSVVYGGQTVIEVKEVYYVIVKTTNINSETIDAEDFIGQFVIDSGGRGVRAYVIAAENGDGFTANPTLMLKYVSAVDQRFVANDEIQTEDGSLLATAVSSNAVGEGSTCSIGEGVFFVRGLFAHIAAQTIILEKHSTIPSYRVGLEIAETIINENNDSSLLDPALDASNYQAPGATRYQLTLTLAKRSLTSTDDTAFIELMRTDSGDLIKKIVYPQLSELEHTLARRTFDESGSYTVRPFQISLQDHSTYSNAHNIILETGKAYILGYEFETISPTTIANERARDVANVYNYPLTVDYQNYVYVTKLYGPIAYDTLAPLTIHCVNSASINTLTSTTATATNIGTIRIRSLDYDSGANASSTNTGIWKAFTFDANLTSRSANCSGSGSSTTIVLDTDASTLDDAYNGMVLRIVTHAGTTYNELATISDYAGATKTATVTQAFSFGTPTTATIFSLDYEFADAESFVYGSSNTITTRMDIDTSSKYASSVDTYQGAFITDTDFNRSIISLPNFAIGDASVVGGTPITNSEYYGHKKYSLQFASNVISFTTASGITSAVNGSPLSGSVAMENILVVTTSAGTLANNQVINFFSGSNTAAVTTAGNTSSYTITVPNGGTQTADVYVKVHLPYAHSLGSIRKSKQNKLANTANVDTGTATVVSTGITWYKQGGTGSSLGAHVVFNNTAISGLQTQNFAQSVYTADVISLAGVYDCGANVASTANLAYASNLTDYYTLTNGQKDNTYDHATIVLRPGYRGPSGNTVVFLNYYEHTGSGYLTVDSYIDGNTAYEDIPNYTSTQTARIYPLRDVIDFRARRKNGDAAGLFDETILGISGTNFETDFSYYLPRIDKVILTKDRTFEVVSGVSSLTPTPPADKENSMTLYTLSLPAYTFSPRDITTKYHDNRRYTMRDVGILEKRISNLEYYTSLSLLEQDAKNQEIVDDASGLNRFKNGILVDPFKGHSIGDVTKSDYNCSIDMQQKELRPPYTSTSFPLSLNENSSTNYKRTGKLLSIDYSESTFIDQPLASQAININPFNVVSYLAQVQIDPSSDTWVDTNQVPDVLVNAEGDNDAWNAVGQALGRAAPDLFGTVWNGWQTQWTGTAIVSQETIVPINRGWLGPGNGGAQEFGDIIQNTITDITQRQTRTGIQNIFSTEAITRSLGNRVVDVSIVPYIRTAGVLFVGKSFRPNTTLYGFFDGQAVQNYINKANIIEVDDTTVKYIDKYQNGEIVNIYEPATSTVRANAIVALSRNGALTTNVHIVNLRSNDSNIGNSTILTTNATFLVGTTSGANTKIIGSHHYSGRVWAASANTVTLQNTVLLSNTTSGYVGKTIYITSGTGLGQYQTIAAYNTTTKQVTTGTWTTTPDNTSTYSIGTMVTTPVGDVAGTFLIPSTDDVRFRTGDRIFRLTDTSSGDLTSSSTNGDAHYFAQGLLQTSEQTILSTRTPHLSRTSLSDEQTVSTRITESQVVGQAVIGYWDPVAQTFLVDQVQYTNGVQLTAIRLLFKSKDDDIPVRVQLRPVVNGYPHSSQIIPMADIVVSAKDVTVVSESTISERFADSTLTQPLDDPSLYTEVRFDGPVTLQPGQEYAVVLIANTIKYEVYISQVGSTILGTARTISTQPYMGSFFKSQNASTWDAVQNQDLMFRLIRAVYQAVTANTEYFITAENVPTANVNVDSYYVTSQNLLLPNTSIFSYGLTTLATGETNAYIPINLFDNTYFDDTLGRRVVTTNQQSFKVRLYLSSTNSDISPLVDMERLSMLAIENKVNTLGLSNTVVLLTNTTSTYVNSNVSIAFSGGGGSGANAYAVITSNAISAIIVDTPGSGYTSSPEVTISGGGGSANAKVVGETSSSGGPAFARYITRKVVLADGMDAGDFRVFLDAYRPSEASIYVYYKILSSDDATTNFDDRDYQLMTIIQGYNNISLNSSDFKEYVYAPGTGNAADNSVQYGSFTNFKYFAIKIVMVSTNPTSTKVPRIRNLRVVATPSV